MEYRQHSRAKVRLTIAYHGDKTDGKGIVHNLSPVGCRVQCKTNVPLGAFFKVEIFPPTPEPAIHIEVAVVRWCMGQAFGLDFLQVKPEHQERLRQVTKKK